jgi:hypothetical protein
MKHIYEFTALPLNIQRTCRIQNKKTALRFFPPQGFGALKHIARLN